MCMIWECYTISMHKIRCLGGCWKRVQDSLCMALSSATVILNYMGMHIFSVQPTYISVHMVQGQIPHVWGNRQVSHGRALRMHMYVAVAGQEELPHPRSRLAEHIQR